MTKAAVFDLDGVLLDSMGIWNDLGARYLRSLGVTPEEGLNEILFSMSMEQGAEYLHTHYALPQSAAEVGAGIADMLRDFYFYEVPAKDGAAALLAALTESRICLTETSRGAEQPYSLKQWRGDIGEAVAYLKKERGLLSIYSYMAATNGVANGYYPLLVAFFRTFPGMTPLLYSFF